MLTSHFNFGHGPRFAAMAVTAVLAILCCGCGGETTDSSGSGNDTASSSSSGASSDAGTADSGGDDVAVAEDATEDTGPSEPPCKPYKKPGDHDWGCPAGQKCIWGAQVGECVPAGTKSAGAECQNPEECAVGICIQNAAGKSRCSPFCISDVQCDKGPCNSVQSGKGKVCDMGGDPVPQCDPLGQSCNAGFACYYTPEGFICQSEGKEADGTKCVADNDCKKGSVCVGKSGGSAGICRKVCATSGSGPKCDIGVNCSTLGGNVGYCDG